MAIRRQSKSAGPAQGRSGDDLGGCRKRLGGQRRPPWVHFYVRRGRDIEPGVSDDEQQPLNIKALGAYVAAARDKKARDGRSERAVWFYVSADPGKIPR